MSEAQKLDLVYGYLLDLQQKVSLLCSFDTDLMHFSPDEYQEKACDLLHGIRWLSIDISKDLSNLISNVTR